MIEVVRSGQWTQGGKAAFEILGKDYGAAVTLILEDMPKGGGPRLHKHPYGETWVVPTAARRSPTTPKRSKPGRGT
jgi:hypothetical protein